LASDRPYRRALPLADAVAHVQELAGIHFDPEVVRILSQQYEGLEAKARAESDKMEPLNTDIIVRRGDAPSAGFEKSEPTAVNIQGATMDAIAHGRLEIEIPRIVAETLTLPDTDDKLPCVTATLAAVIPFNILIIYVRRGEVLHPYYVSGNRTAPLSPVELPVGLGLCGWVAQSRQHILNGNPSVEVEAQAVDPRMPQMQSSLAVPLVSKEDSVVGVLALYHTQQDAFSSAHLGMLLSVKKSFTTFLQGDMQNMPAPYPYQSQSAENQAVDLAEVG
jgi:GAF domain-containing protein